MTGIVMNLQPATLIDVNLCSSESSLSCSNTILGKICLARIAKSHQVTVGMSVLPAALADATSRSSAATTSGCRYISSPSVIHTVGDCNPASTAGVLRWQNEMGSCAVAIKRRRGLHAYTFPYTHTNDASDYIAGWRRTQQSSMAAELSNIVVLQCSTAGRIVVAQIAPPDTDFKLGSRRCKNWDPCIACCAVRFT